MSFSAPKHEIITTADGSSSLYLPHLDETYHSRHGAVQESLHVFIRNGLDDAFAQGRSQMRVLEVGFGTGLNALLALQWTDVRKVAMHYFTVEPFILPLETLAQLHYDANDQERFLQLHQAPWNEDVELFPTFTLKKLEGRLGEVDLPNDVDVVFYDAFGPRAQSDMWSVELFALLFARLQPGGVLVTYCAKGQVRRDLQTAGFVTERLPGPPGKREMLRATKPVQP